MSDKGSVFQKGGGGTNFEQYIQTAFLTTLIVHGNVPCFPASELIEVAFQVTNRGYQTDDLLAIAKSNTGQHRLLIQAKYNISFTVDNDLFKEVINAFWKDYNNSTVFDRKRDKLIVVKSGMTKDERNHLKSLFNWAVTHSSETDFISEVERIKAKNERLDVFRQLLKVANNDIALTDKELWEFLKCVDVLEYDFLNQSSVDETYFLNLIKLSKDINSSATEKEIWDSIFAYAARLNKDGGSETIHSITQQDFFRHFKIEKLSAHYKAISKLKSDSSEILRPIKTTIGKGKYELHISKPVVSDKIAQSIGNHQITIVTGKPGTGKSAEVKEILNHEFLSASAFVFRADQFNAPTISNVFSSLGVHESIKDIFSCMSLIPDKIIFIDSLEKLLEADPECAFKQLLALLKDFPDIKLIGTSRKYAIDLIIFKFGLDKNEIAIIDLPQLDEKELLLIEGQFPQLKNVLRNNKIAKLIQSPKYLDFLLSSIDRTGEDYSQVSTMEFKNKLWDSLVCDSSKKLRGLPAKREKAFLEIAVKRAKEMTLFTSIVDTDEEAVDCLENDEIIFQENGVRKYAPSHDILEDWALSKYVSAKFDEHSDPKDLFDNLGNEPAIRRAFRLWVADELLENYNEIYDLIEKALTDNTIEKYWADELLIAILRSEDCSSFFNRFKKDLLSNEAFLLRRCIHLVRTACKETFSFNTTILLPTGSGWTEIIFFIKENLTALDDFRLLIYNLIYEWEFRLLFDSVNEDEAIAVKNIVLRYIDQVESDDKFWNEREQEERIKELIFLLFNLAKYAREEIVKLIDKVIVIQYDKKNRDRQGFYKILLDCCLSGLRNSNLIKECPHEIIKLAWQDWKLPPPEEPSKGSIAALIHAPRLRGDDCWGIRDKHSFFPSGIYKIPIYNLLLHHPFLALKFITEFLNYSVEFYINSDCDYKHSFDKVDVILNDGVIVSQWAAWELWAAYRGISVTHCLIESILMSFEKYMLDLAQSKTAISKQNIQFIFDYLFRNSNNVLTTGVLVSVALAYPEVVEEQMVPLLSVREFYEWDSARVIQESGAFAPMDNQISFAQEERYKSNKLSHRTKYFQGLSDFVIDYQIKIRTANEKIHTLFDKLYKSVEDGDIYWKKKLSDIDVRSWEGKIDEENNQVVFQPKYEDDVNNFIESNKSEVEANRITMKWAGLIWNAHDKKEAISFETWVDAYDYYQNPQVADPMFDRPISLAIIGIRDFDISLSNGQREWCINKIITVLSIIRDDTINMRYHLNRNYNLMEKETALQSFHLLYPKLKAKKEKIYLLGLLLDTLILPFGDHEIKKSVEYIRTIFFHELPLEANRIWIALIDYARFKKSNQFYYDDHDQNRSSKAKEKDRKFIQKLLNQKATKANLGDVNISDYEPHLLFRAFLILPTNSSKDSYLQFIKEIISISISELQVDDEYSYRSKRKRKLDYSTILDSESFLADIQLNVNFQSAREILDILLEPFLKVREYDFFYARDLHEFVKGVFEFMVLKISDFEFATNLPSNHLEQSNQFWQLWEYLYDAINASSEKPFMGTVLFNVRFLLFDLNWKPLERQWEALKDKKDFYFRMIRESGENNIDTIMNVFSIVGENAFLPEGLSLIVDLAKKRPSKQTILVNPSGERFIKKLFYNHISIIKKSKKLTNDFIWLLNVMTDLGSSLAYMIRENVITYKTILN